MSDPVKRLYKVYTRDGVIGRPLTDEEANAKAAQKWRLEVVPNIPGVEIADPDRFAQLDDVQRRQAAADASEYLTMVAAFDEMIRLRQKYGTEVSNREAVASYNRARNSAIGAAARIGGAGTVQIGEFERYASMVPEIGPSMQDLYRLTSKGDPVLAALTGARDTGVAEAGAKMRQHGIAPPAPEAAKPPKGDAKAGAPEPNEPSAVEAFARNLGNPMGAGGEITSGIAEALESTRGDDGTGIPRTYAAGSRYADLRNAVDAERERATEAHPIAGGAGRVIADTAVAAVVPGGAAVQGAVVGGASAAGESKATGDELLRDVAAGAAGGAVGGKAAEKILGVAANKAPAVQKWLAEKSARARVGAATGRTGAEFRNLEDNIGREGVERLGKSIDDLLSRRGDIAPSTAQYERRALDLIPSETASLKAAEDAAERAGVQVETKDIARWLEEKAAGKAKLSDPLERRTGADAAELASNIRKGSRFGKKPFREAVNEKRSMQDAVNYTRKGGADAAPYAEETRRELAKKWRGNVDKAYEDHVIRDANLSDKARALREAKGKPLLRVEDAEQYRKANADLTTTLQVANDARKYAGRSDGNLLPAIRLPELLAANLGATVAGPAGAVLAPAATGVLRGRGKSLAATGYKAAEKAIGSEAVRRAAAPIKVAAAEGASSASSDKAEALSRRSNIAPKPDNIRKLAEKQPEVFGKYGPELHDAASDPVKFSAARKRLIETDPSYQEHERMIKREATP